MRLEYSNDIIWYDESVKSAIEALGDKYSNAIPVFACALSAYNSSIEDLVGYFPDVISNAKFYHWHEGVVGALRRFCRLCLVDPDLIEVYLGISFAELVE